jgi:hypothetical protein
MILFGKTPGPVSIAEQAPFSVRSEPNITPKGSRFSSSGANDDIAAGRRYGHKILSILPNLPNLMFGAKYSDLCYSYNAFWSCHLPVLALDCTGFEAETVMSIHVAQAGLRVQEVPSHERPRVHGRGNLRIIKDGRRIVKVIVRERLNSYRRQRADLLKQGLFPEACAPAITKMGGVSPIINGRVDEEGE